ncbi:hypothetical protein, partial [Delftia tsuruhatensis]|uniref:hypothetical protein n=1 Tax=Delftia tsuruhatensis TaxID=180282 RepID=UPI0020287771
VGQDSMEMVGQLCVEINNQGTFDRKAQITRTPDGTLASERSLMMQTGKQVKEDAAPLIDEAKEAVKKALKK